MCKIGRVHFHGKKNGNPVEVLRESSFNMTRAGDEDIEGGL